MFSILDGRTNFYQWDINQKLIVNDNTVKQVHFCNKTDDCALVCEVYKENGLNVVNVPNILLQNDWDIRAYAYCSNYTKIEKRFKVLARSKPESYSYTETEVKTWEALEQRVIDLEVNGVPQETIKDSIDNYFKENPIEAGATKEQAAQIEQNKKDIEELESDCANFATTGYVDKAIENIDIKDIDLTGYAKKTDIPTTLPNPQVLTFTGAATGSYNGSEALTVNIPTGGSGETGGSCENWEPIYRKTFENVTKIEETIEGLSEYRKFKVALYLEYDKELEGQDYKCQITTFTVAGMKLFYYGGLNGSSASYNYAVLMSEVEVIDKISNYNNGVNDLFLYRKSTYVGANQPIVTTGFFDETAEKKHAHSTVNNGMIYENISTDFIADKVVIQASEEMYKIRIGIYATK